jgi:hypothetical protein
MPIFLKTLLLSLALIAIGATTAFAAPSKLTFKRSAMETERIAARDAASGEAPIRVISRDVGHRCSRWSARKVGCSYFLYGYNVVGDAWSCRRDVHVKKSKRGRVSAAVVYRYCWSDGPG